MTTQQEFAESRKSVALGDVLYSLRDVSVEYGTRAGAVAAVDRVSLDIKKGEVSRRWERR